MTRRDRAPTASAAESGAVFQRQVLWALRSFRSGDFSVRLPETHPGVEGEIVRELNRVLQTSRDLSLELDRVSKLVGKEGQLGVRAALDDSGGAWSACVTSVNELIENMVRPTNEVGRLIGAIAEGDENLTTQVRAISDVVTAVTKGDLDRYATVEASGEVATLKDNINEMIRNLKETTRKTTEQDWLKTQLAHFTRVLQGQRDLTAVARLMLAELAPLVSAQHGVIYAAQPSASGEVRLTLLATYGCADSAPRELALGQGLIGQVALEKKKLVVEQVPEGYASISSGLGRASPKSLTLVPVLFEGRVTAMIELGAFHPLSDIHQAFLDQLTETVGIVINTISTGMQTRQLLEQSQSLTRELQSQQEELRQTNERLELQAATLRLSEERLKQQQEVLQVTNEQLEDKAGLLEVKNREVELAKAEIEEKVEQLALASKYKSEFLANMSHELRTPLNSLLILSAMLADNVDGNLTEKQVEFAKTIHASGNDLLALINDVLDLSKIESGTIAVHPGDVGIADLRDYVEKVFRHVALQRGLEFQVEVAAGTPDAMVTDAQRLRQVLKNLLSNAFKFTERGRVALRVSVASSGWSPGHEKLGAAECVIAFSVVDTGIGIPEEKHRIIFEAFQQSDGTTSRRYGGTGLGLSISREIARVLGGEIGVESSPGSGSTFTFYLPRTYSPPPQRTERVTPRSPTQAVTELPRPQGSSPFATAVLDDVDGIDAEEPVLVVVDEDSELPRAARDAARRRALKAIVAKDAERASALVTRLNVASVALGLGLPDSEGLAFLDWLKHEPRARHVPVAVFADPAARGRALAMGAIHFAGKPPTREELEKALDRALAMRASEERRLLVAGGSEAWRDRMKLLLGGEGVTVVAATADDLPKSLHPACIVTRFDAEGPALLEGLAALANGSAVPVVAHVDGNPRREDRERIRSAGLPFVIRYAATDEALLDHSTVFLHRPERTLSPMQQMLLTSSRRSVPELDGVRVLVVDDDVRNIYAVASMLERHRALVNYADNGSEGLALLAKHPDIRVVLMDIMMPEMDGYDVIRQIREQPAHAELPVIALTAKAMRSDREKCLRAGASDYVAKPVDVERLLSTLRVWLSQ